MWQMPIDDSEIRIAHEARVLVDKLNAKLECYADTDEIMSEVSSTGAENRYDSLDEVIDEATRKEAFSIASLVRGQPQKKKVKRKDLRPIAFVRLNTSLGKPKPVMIKALLDSGGSACLLNKQLAKKLRIKGSKNAAWSTPAGKMNTSQKTKTQFTIPELHDNRVIEWDVHLTDNLGAYDMIIGRDLLEFLGIDVRFSTLTLEWDGVELPFKNVDDTIEEAYHVDEPDMVKDSIKKILDADYNAADLDEVCKEQVHLNDEEQNKLLELLNKYEDLFDGTLGKWKGSQADLELKEEAKPYHAKAFPIPRVHMETLKTEVQRLCDIGVLKKVNRSEWAAPTFIIPKKNKTVRFISDFRELNKRIKRKPYPIPKIQDMLLNLEGFQYATSLDLNMGFYHIELTPNSKRLCTIVLPFGKYEYQRIPMGLCNSPDIFQEKMSELMDGLEFARVYIDDLMAITKGDFDDHLAKLDLVLARIRKAGLKVNAKKSFFAKAELEYLGYWITREGIKPLANKVEAIMKIAEPKNRKELRSFIGIVNYYRDMWIRRSHILAPLATLTSKTTRWKWGPEQSKAFQLAKRVIARQTMLAYPGFNKPLQIHTDASHHQLGAVISQDGRPVAFYSRKLNPAQTRYTTTERELLSIVETLKEYRNILLGHEIEVFTDHQNLVYKHFNTERVMRWRLLLEEFGPKLTYIKGANNVVADALSRLGMTNWDFDMELDAFAAGDEADFPTNFPLSHKQMRHFQQLDEQLKQKVLEKPERYKLEPHRFSDSTIELITREGKIVLPEPLQLKATEWYHTHLLHPGETRMELTIGQHFCWKGMRATIQRVRKACQICKTIKRSNRKYGLLPPKEPETIPWHTLCIDLIGPYKIGKRGKLTENKLLSDPDKTRSKHEVHLWCLTMIDPATGWFEIEEIPNRRADFIANILEMAWLTRYPWPTEVVMDRGSEFKGEVQDLLKNEYGFARKMITTRNPQANAMVERAHQTMHNMVRSIGIKKKEDLDEDFGWRGILAAVRHAMHATVHTTMRATPSQLVFARDALLNVSFEADWQYIKERKQKLIIQNNKRENATRIPHQYQVGGRVMVRLEPNRKHGTDRNAGPYTVTHIYDNGTVRLSQAANNGGAVSQTWNIRNLTPCKD